MKGLYILVVVFLEAIAFVSALDGEFVWAVVFAVIGAVVCIGSPGDDE